MIPDSPCHGCEKRCLLCHAHCDEYAKWAKEVRERPKRPKHEINADSVLVTQGERIRKAQQQRWYDKHGK